MALKNILVAYNGSASSDAALKAAILLHRKYRSHITGLLGFSSPEIHPHLLPWMSKNLAGAIYGKQEEANREIEAKFYRTIEPEVPGDNVHWIAERGRANATIAEYARMFDLTVVGRYDPLVGAEHLELHPDRIALKSGRPILVIPRDWQPSDIHEHAVFAWDGHRTATRALADAIVILETTKLVTVLIVETGNEGKPLKGIDVKSALKRHDIDVEMIRIQPEGRTAAQAILDYCVEHRPSLLVMGAYEHNAFREDVVGGVTRRVVHEAPLPILMSH